MKVVFSEPFKRDYGRLSNDIQKLLDKSLKSLIESLRYPSLRAKKIPGTSIWYARISRAYRFTFNLEGSVVILRRVGTHKILDQERKTA